VDENFCIIFSKEKQEHFRLCESNKDIVKNIKSMKYNICWRFHSIILSIINSIPFITFSSTPKVENLLKDNQIEDLYFNFIVLLL
jgi:polysaccharide pyruvyl transferase WcaK-like protein